jgi:hypothetical protein
MNEQQIQNEIGYETELLERLRELYLRHIPIPNLAGEPLTIEQFYRYYRYIKAEGYGK